MPVRNARRLARHIDRPHKDTREEQLRASRDRGQLRDAAATLQENVAGIGRSSTERKTTVSDDLIVDGATFLNGGLTVQDATSSNSFLTLTSPGHAIVGAQAGASSQASMYLGRDGATTAGGMVYSNASDTLALHAGTGSRVEISSASANFDSGTMVVDFTNNRVGVGTSTPQRPFHVQRGTGSIPLDTDETLMMFSNNEDAGDNADFAVVAGTAGSARVFLGDADDENAGVIKYNNATDALSFRTASAGTDVLIDSSGKVGIGTTSPSEELDVAGDIKATGTVEAGGATFHGALASAPGSPAAGDFYFDTTTSKHRGYDGSAWSDFH